MIQFKLPDMTCGHCEKTVRATVAQVDADAKVTVDLGTHQVSIDGKADRETLARAIRRRSEPGTLPAVPAGKGDRLRVSWGFSSASAR